MEKIHFSEITCRKIVGGKRPLWHAQLLKDVIGPSYGSIIGSGNTAENAMKDLREQIRRRNKV